MYNVSVLFVEGNGWCSVAKCGCFLLLIADFLYHHCGYLSHHCCYSVSSLSTLCIIIIDSSHCHRHLSLSSSSCSHLFSQSSQRLLLPCHHRREPLSTKSTIPNKHARDSHRQEYHLYRRRPYSPPSTAAARSSCSPKGD